MIEKELQGSARPEEAPELPSLAETAIEEDCGNDAATPVSPTKGLLSSSAGFLVGIFHKLTGSVFRNRCVASMPSRAMSHLAQIKLRNTSWDYQMCPVGIEKQFMV